MVRPTRPKDIKPKAEGSQPSEPSGGGFDSNKLIMVNTITTVLICVLFIGGNYFVQDKLLSSKLQHIQTGTPDEEAQEGASEEEEERGLILDLGEFILNLSDAKARRYLKVNVAIELTRTDTDPDMAGGDSGGGGHGHGAAVDPMKLIEVEMSQYKPSVRDAIISTLSSKTAEELSTVAGKELAKEQIKESVDAIFGGKREVLRVSFGTFIIQ
jgi:flagellar FliL protein